jgi:hypothetical protein
VAGEHPNPAPEALSRLLDRTVEDTLSMCGYIRPEKPAWAALRFDNGTRLEAHGIETEVDELRGHIPDRLTFTSWTFTDGKYTFTFENPNDRQQYATTFTYIAVTFDPNATTRTTTQHQNKRPGNGKTRERFGRVLDRVGETAGGTRWNLPS